jgi:peptidylprolyl isomerase
MLSRRPPLLLAASFLALSLVAACGDDDDDDNAATAEATSTAGGDTGGDPCPGEDGAGDGDAAASGDTVRVHYCGTLDDGTLFDSSEDDPNEAPLEFTLGAGDVVPGFDAAVTGMLVGERKTVTISAADAYGERSEDLVQEIPVEQFGGQVPEPGSQVQSSTGATATILEVNEDTVTVDFNHRLAGENLTFEIELVEIV